MANFNSTYEDVSKQILAAPFSTPGPDCHLKYKDFWADSPVDQETGSNRRVSFSGSIDRVPYGSVPDDGAMNVLSEAEALVNLAKSIQAALGGPLYVDSPPDSPEEGGNQSFLWVGNVKRDSGAMEIVIVAGWVRLGRGVFESGSPVW